MVMVMLFIGGKTIVNVFSLKSNLFLPVETPDNFVTHSQTRHSPLHNLFVLHLKCEYNDAAFVRHSLKVHPFVDKCWPEFHRLRSRKLCEPHSHQEVILNRQLKTA